MKNLKKLLISASIFALAASAFAEGKTFYFDLSTASGDFKLSEAASAGTWYSEYKTVSNENGSTSLVKTEVAAPTEEDFIGNNNFIFFRSGDSSVGTITVDKSVVANTWASGGGFAGMGADTNVVFSIADNINMDIATVKVGTNAGYSFINGNMSVGSVAYSGNGVIKFGSHTNPLKSFTIDKISTQGDSHGFFSVLSTSNGGTIYNPDAKIGSHVGREYPSYYDPEDSVKVLDGALAYATYDRMYSTIRNDSVVWVSEVKDFAGFVTFGNPDSYGKVTYVLTTNVEKASTQGMIWQGYVTSTEGVYYYNGGHINPDKDGCGKIALVMMSGQEDSSGNFIYANNTQEFTGDHLYWSGGVKMISGTLLVNFNAAEKGNEEYNNHGTLELAKASGAQATTFGSSSADVGGSFAFSDIKVADDGGTIRVRLSQTGNDNPVVLLDLITLTGQDDIKGKVTGTGNIKIELDAVAGEYASDYFGLLIRDKDSEKSTWAQFISWKEAAEDTVSFEVTDEYKTWEDGDGNLYNFEFYNGADGLYGAYIAVAVPEPSTYAAIFGALALGFALYRRRK